MFQKIKLTAAVVILAVLSGCSTTSPPQATTGSMSPVTIYPGDDGLWIPDRTTASQRAAVASEEATYEASGPFPINMADLPIGVPGAEGKVPMKGSEPSRIESPIADELADQLRAEALALPPTHIAQAQSMPMPLAGTTGVGFDSLDTNDCCGGGTNVPPDSELAVGPNHIIAVVNVAFAIYDKSGTLLVGPTTFADFFSGVPNCSGVFDPNVLYDEEYDRFILGIDANGDDYCVAASQGSDPTLDWHGYSFATDILGRFFDYPHAGVGQDAIYLGANMFSLAGSFAEGRVWAIEKSALYSGGTPAVVTKSTGSEGTPQPMNLHGYGQGTWPIGGPHYILTDGPFNGRNYGVWSWNDPFGANQLVDQGTVDLQILTGTVASFPIDAAQLGSIELLQANDWRVQDAEYRNGAIWMVHTFSGNPGSGTVNGLRWAQIDPTGTPTVLDAGVLITDGDHRIFGDLAANHCDDMAVGYTKTGASMYPSVYLAGRESTDSPGTLQSEVALKAGEIRYDSFQGSGPHRWGDYTGMTIDPDGTTFWYLGQYSKDFFNAAGTNWANYVGSFSFSSCSVAPQEPGKAGSPSPLDGAVNVSVNADLNWSAGSGATSHDVYLNGIFQRNQTETMFDPGTLTPSTTYTWRIDEVNDVDTTMGDTWSFTTEAELTAPDPAANPSPVDGSVNVSTTAILSWSAGARAETHNVYFGTSNPPALQGNQAGTSFDPGVLAEGQTYFWQIDEVNGTGTTPGTVWSFTTEAAIEATPVHVAALTGTSSGLVRNRWTATVQIDVASDTDTPVSGVLVEGTWSGGARGGASCTTNGSGQCSVSKANLKASALSADFAVNNLSGTDITYDAGSNVVSSVNVAQDGEGGNLLPVADDDFFTTPFKTVFSDNVLDNDDQGDAPATVTSHDLSSELGVDISVDPSGDFSYTPPAATSGEDTFGYTITDSNGDPSSATVTITIQPEGGVPVSLTIGLTKLRGITHADLNWTGGTGAEKVTITRDGNEVDGSPADNTGSFQDPLGKRASGTSYIYKVCELNSDRCDSASITF